MHQYDYCGDASLLLLLNSFDEGHSPLTPAPLSRNNQVRGWRWQLFLVNDYYPPTLTHGGVLGGGVTCPRSPAADKVGCTPPLMHAVLWLPPRAHISLFCSRILPGSNPCETNALYSRPLRPTGMHRLPFEGRHLLLVFGEASRVEVWLSKYQFGISYGKMKVLLGYIPN